jgi:K+-transporting ATPase A subunit
MGQRWLATIRTQSNVLQNIEIETPGIVRQDAIAQIKSTYGAKEVVTCNPISSSSSSSSSSGSYSSGSSDGSWFWVLLFGAMMAVYVFRYIIIAAVVLIALYYLYKWFKK